ncbi:PepSY-associated TM helix domain-containing protein [Corynebacterium flavescens]|uniref:PepSY-associated TM helix domain-containing protein n=1 Tax=Corynebacterium flavescens TaxID=28028 RepID=UPI003FD69AD4
MVRRIHVLAGVFVAPLLFVAALTGLFYAAAPTAEAWVYRHAMNATPGIPAQSLEAQAEVAQAVHPNLPLSGMQVSEDASTTTRVLFSDPSLPGASYKRAVFVDPGSLEIRGDLVQYGSSQALPLRTWISEGHRSLWLGEPGRIYSETAASWLGAITLAGAWVWCSRRRRLAAASHARKPGARRRLEKLHSRLGLRLLPGFLFLTVTGLTWSMVAGGTIVELRAQLNWLDPKPATSLSASEASTSNSAHSEHRDHAENSGHEGHSNHSLHEGHAAQEVVTSQNTAVVDTVVHAARDEGLSGLLDVTAPADSTSAWVVKEARQPWRFSNDAISIDGSTGAVVDKVEASHWPLAARLSNWLIQLHMGMLFGWINQLALAMVAAGLLAIICLGYRMWWMRGRDKGFGSLPFAGQWKKTSPLARTVVVILLIAYSLLAPLFGLSLLAFLLIDVASRQTRRLLKHRSEAKPAQ